MTKPTPEELKLWREAAEKVSESTWTWDGHFQGAHLGETLICLDDTYEGSEEACSHIANMNPENALRLIARVEELEKLETHMQMILNLVNHQAELDEIWRPYNVKDRHPAQHALRALHALIERDAMTLAALEGGGE